MPNPDFAFGRRPSVRAWLRSLAELSSAVVTVKLLKAEVLDGFKNVGPDSVHCDVLRQC